MTEIPLERLHPELRAITTAFVDLVRKADAESRVNWRCGNYLELISKLPTDTPVFYNDGWKRAEEYL